jgi:glycosyltransferase involved in cell wall biosynthesis
MILSIITISRYYDDKLLKTIRSVDYDFSSFIDKHEVEHIIVCGEEIVYTNTSERKYLYAPPKGIYNAMNIGLNNAIGEWIWFLNAGDKCMKGISEKLLHTILFCNKQGKNIIKAGVESVSNYGSKTVFGKVVSPHQGTFYKRCILSDTGGFREDFKMISDRVLFDEFLMQGIKMYQSKLIAAKFYENGISSTCDGRWLICKESYKYAMEHPVNVFRWYRYLKSIYNYFT